MLTVRGTIVGISLLGIILAVQFNIRNVVREAVTYQNLHVLVFNGAIILGVAPTDIGVN